MKRRPIFYPLVFLAPSLWMSAAHAAIGEIDVNAGPPAAAVPETPDRSTLWFEVKTRASVLLIDAKGRRTGLNPKTRHVLQEIPHSRCEVDYVDNPYTGEKEVEAYQRITIEPAVKGTYRILVRGIQDGPFEINITALAANGSSMPSKQLEGLISEGRDKSFHLQYDPTAHAEMTVVEDAPR